MSGMTETCQGRESPCSREFNPETGMSENKHAIEVDEDTGRMRSRPQIFSLEVSNRCNLRCTMCGFHSIYREERVPGSDMNEDIYERALPFVGTAELVPLCGGGEPLLHPDLEDMVRRVSERGVPTVITPNGILLHRKRAGGLMDAGLTYVEFSVDGIASYQGIRGVPFETLETNIRGLAALKEERGSRTPIIDLSYTAMKDTLPELIGILELGAGVGAREVRVQPLQVFFEPLLSQNIYLEPEESIELLEKARARARELGIKLCVRRASLAEDNRYGDDERSNRLLMRYGCLEPFNSLTVRVDGSIQVCCAGLTLPYNLRESGLDEIWNSKEMRELRLGLITGKPAAACRECALVAGSAKNQVKLHRKASLREFVRLERSALREYRDHIRKRGIIMGNLDAVRRLRRELGGESG